VSPISIFAPAKLNLFLAVTGRRPDGFHDIVSVVAQLNFGDTLRAEPADGFSLQCTDPEVPVDETNLVMKAARAFAVAADWNGGAAFVLEKRVPMGAGLGGGSSDAVATLRALNQMVDAPCKLSPQRLTAVAANLGSDCALFLHDGPVVMRGRGERIARLAAGADQRLRERRVLVFKPGFGIATPWSYAQLAAGAPSSYLPAETAEGRLEAWFDNSAQRKNFCSTTWRRRRFAKYIALPVLCRELEQRFGVKATNERQWKCLFLALERNRGCGADRGCNPSTMGGIRVCHRNTADVDPNWTRCSLPALSSGAAAPLRSRSSYLINGLSREDRNHRAGHCRLAGDRVWPNFRSIYRATLRFRAIKWSRKNALMKSRALTGHWS
jgi:4-diphosphocytidyl-2-C-methyl-D-erythritol kinase